MLDGGQSVTDSSSTTRFIATVALSTHAAASGNAVVERIRTAYSAMSFDIEVPDTTPETLGRGILMRFEGVVISVTFLNEPMPAGVLSELLGQNQVWKDAGAALAGHRAQAIVSTLDVVTDHASALNAAAYVTFVAGALCSLLPTAALGVAWLPAGTLTPAKAFADAAVALSKKQLPIMSWVRFDPATYPDAAAPMPTATMRTSGLAPFAKRELFCGSRIHALPRIGAGVIEVANAMIGRGAFINDGDTMTIPGIGDGKARFGRSNETPPRDILILDLDAGAAVRKGGGG